MRPAAVAVDMKHVGGRTGLLRRGQSVAEEVALVFQQFEALRHAALDHGERRQELVLDPEDRRPARRSPSPSGVPPRSPARRGSPPRRACPGRSSPCRGRSRRSPPACSKAAPNRRTRRRGGPRSLPSAPRSARESGDSGGSGRPAGRRTCCSSPSRGSHRRGSAARPSRSPCGCATRGAAAGASPGSGRTSSGSCGRPARARGVPGAAGRRSAPCPGSCSPSARSGPVPSGFRLGSIRMTALLQLFRDHLRPRRGEVVSDQHRGVRTARFVAVDAVAEPDDDRLFLDAPAPAAADRPGPAAVPGSHPAGPGCAGEVIASRSWRRCSWVRPWTETLTRGEDAATARTYALS